MPDTVLGLPDIGTEPIGGGKVWSVPTVTITAPSGSVSTSTITVTWNFSDTGALGQEAYRVQLAYQGSGSFLVDTGWTVSASASHALSYTLQDLSTYTVTVSARTPQGEIATDTQDFLVQLTSVASFADNTDVGKVWEVAINGVGYMLADRGQEGEDFEWERTTIPLEPPRLATGQTPFEEAVERYNFTTFTDFSGGAGQERYNLPSSIATAFMDSENVDPFTNPGKLQLLFDTNEIHSDTYANPLLAVVNDTWYVLTADRELNHAADDVTDGNFTVTGSGAFVDMTSDGQRWYACDGTDIYRGTTADPVSAWSTIDGEVIHWAGGRICAAYADASPASSTPNVFTTLNDAGTEEVTNGRLTLNPGWTIRGMTDGSGYVFFGAYSGQEGEVWAWNIGSSDAPFQALPLPPGEVPVDLHWHQGSVYVRVDRPNATHDTPQAIYRCPVGADGTLTPFSVVEDSLGASGTFAGLGDLVFFSWTGMSSAGISGIGAIDITTGGYAKCYFPSAESGATGHVVGVDIWNGRPIFTVAAEGLQRVHPTTRASSGWLKTSIVDAGSTLSKVWDEVSLQASPLASGSSASVDYSFNGGGSYTSLSAVSLTDAGVQSAKADLDIRSLSLGLRVNLTRGGTVTATPLIESLTMRYHPLALADTLVLLPIECSDNYNGLNGARLGGVPGSGSERLATLESLVQTRVKFQDSTWQWTGTSEIMEVVGVQAKKWQVRDGLRIVAMTTLRKKAV